MCKIGRDFLPAKRIWPVKSFPSHQAREVVNSGIGPVTDEGPIELASNENSPEHSSGSAGLDHAPSSAVHEPSELTALADSWESS